jgi:putative sterol carrier protein
MSFESAAAFFDTLQNRMQNDEETRANVAELGATYLFKVEGAGNWLVNLTDAVITQEEGEADCTISVENDDWVQLINGEVNGQQLFMLGKILIEGDVGLALQLEQIFNAAAE